MTSNITLRAKRNAGRYERQKPSDPSTYPASAATGLKPSKIAPDEAKNGEGLVAQLNERFRVVIEGGTDPRQWFLQRGKGESWATISFCATREGLLLSIREKCVPIELFKRRHDYPGLDVKAIAAIKALPVRFPRRGTT